MYNYPVAIDRFWYGLPWNLTHIDAIYERRSGQREIVIFIGRQYWVYPSNDKVSISFERKTVRLRWSIVRPLIYAVAEAQRAARNERLTSAVDFLGFGSVPANQAGFARRTGTTRRRHGLGPQRQNLLL